MTPESQTPKKECDEALRCLFIAVESSIAVSVNEKVGTYIASLEIELAQTKEKIAKP